MAKPALAGEEDAVALRRRLRRLVAAVTAGGAAPDAFDEAAAALAALREAEVGGGRKGGGVGGAGGEEEPSAEEVVAVPAQFLCPISSEIMRDPVVVETGQTYDRPFIEEWFSAGNQICPQTNQVLFHTTVIPNHLVRTMISRWCTENGFTLPQIENQYEDHGNNSERKTFDEIFVKITTSSSSGERKQAIKDLRLLTKRNSKFRTVLGERPDSISQIILARSIPGLQNDPQVLEDMVTIILNFSIHDRNKKVIGDDTEAIQFLIWALKSGDMGSRSNSAAAIFTLSALDANKEKIGKLGAMDPLIDLLEHGSIIAKKDAASAIFSLCLLHENKSIATRSGIVDVAMSAIEDQSLINESLAILALLSRNDEMVEIITEFNGTACMLSAIRESGCKRSKENAVVVLSSICTYNRTKLKEVEADESMNGSLALLAQNGTQRARRKASSILEKMSRTLHNRHSSC
ncbi:hypothetical protein GUJ93_ZPchr0015g6736 [Zizania palustris]|uniref:U-box domain-containing protein n=1 Tax=Zizania palustris TaxID=103762 RepID=A0A8J5SYK2_ZIZPA|nr:hypothetical protein GUJ93_ZPchr0015g6736 [Zizania palustris]